MIYNLDTACLDLDMLEYVSEIIETPIEEYYFRYQINGYVYNTSVFSLYTDIVEIRDSLINTWLKNMEEIG